MYFNVKAEEIQQMQKDDNIKARDFAEIAEEECAELIQAITKIKRGRTTATDLDKLVEEMADNILATIYLMESLDLSREVADELERKHTRNMQNAQNQNFVKRETCRTANEIVGEINDLVLKAKGKEPILAALIDETYAMVVERHFAYGMVYLKKYDQNGGEDDDITEMLYGDPVITESYVVGEPFNLEKTIRTVYEKYKTAIIL